jgi:hydroxypyruvate isomerase
MERRDFIKTSAGSMLGAAVANTGSSAEPAPAEIHPGKYHLRYAPRLDFLSSGPDAAPIPRRLEIFAEHGFAATEYNGLMNHPMSEVEEMRKKLDSLKMQMGIFVANPKGWNEAGMVLPEQRQAFLGQVRQAIQYHKVIGNNFCTVITGPEKVGVPRGQQRIHVIEALRRAAELVEKTDLTLVVEPLNQWVDHAGYFLSTSEEAAEVMHAVNSQHIKILFDIYHQQITEGNLINNIRRYWDYIGYFQVGDVPGRREPGTGEVNWRNVFRAIHEKGYKGILGMEHGLSVPGMAGLLKCFDEYRKADAW